jgi:hypothetical protein
MSGLPVPEIATKMSAPEREQIDVPTLARAIEEVASYLYPWGISAYLQIAAHVLDLEVTVPITSLPGLVKYGVPEATAAWLMGFGVTTRSVAIRLATEYSRDDGEPVPMALRSWLSRQDPLELGGKLGASGEYLAELAGVLARTRRTGLSRDLQSGHLLPRVGHVAVLGDRDLDVLRVRLVKGAALSLVRDYDSSLDRNSIRVEFDGRDVGPLDPASCALLAIEIDSGVQVRAAVADRRDTDEGVLLDLELT